MAEEIKDEELEKYLKKHQGNEKFATNAQSTNAKNSYDESSNLAKSLMSGEENLQGIGIDVGEQPKIVEDMSIDDLAKALGFKDNDEFFKTLDSKDAFVQKNLKRLVEEKLGSNTYGAFLDNIAKHNTAKARENVANYGDARGFGEYFKESPVSAVVNTIGNQLGRVFFNDRYNAAKSGDYSTKGWNGGSTEYDDGSITPSEVLDASLGVAAAIPTLGLGKGLLGLLGYAGGNAAVPMASEVSRGLLLDKEIDPKNIVEGTAINMAAPYALGRFLSPLMQRVPVLRSLDRVMNGQPGARELASQSDKMAKDAFNKAVTPNQGSVSKSAMNKASLGATEFNNLMEDVTKARTVADFDKIISRTKKMNLTQEQSEMLNKAMVERKLLHGSLKDGRKITSDDKLNKRLLKLYEMDYMGVPLQTLITNKYGDLNDPSKTLGKGIYGIFDDEK